MELSAESECARASWSSRWHAHIHWFHGPISRDWSGTIQSRRCIAGYSPFLRRLWPGLSVSMAVLWLCTLQLTFENPAMPGPGFYVVGSVPWLGWLSVVLLTTGVGFEQFGGLTFRTYETPNTKRPMRLLWL